jgi:hypothetical protein
MILVIAPLVQRGAVDYRGVLRACFYMASLVATAVTFFLIVSALGRAAIGTALAPILPVLALALALREIGVVRLALPDSAFRVPRRWLRLGYWRGPITYGLAMGPGLFTSTPFASYHMLLLWLLLDSTPASAIHGSAVRMSTQLVGYSRAPARFM